MGALKGSLTECTFPIALFEIPVLHKAKRSILADSIFTSAKKKSAYLPETAQFVIDGGALLHRILWQCGSSVMLY